MIYLRCINREEIVEQYGKYEEAFAMSTDFGSVTPEFVTMNLIVDDGNKSRSNRQMMFDGKYYKIGFGTSKHSTFRQCTVILYATNFIKGAKKAVLKKAKVSNYNEEDNGIDYQEDLMQRELRDNYQDVDLPEGVSKIEKNEKYVMENGKKKTITKIIKYMDNGEINTEVFKSDA